MLRKQVPIAAKQGQLAPLSNRPAPSSTVLLTGFTPFGGADTNVSWQVAQQLGGVLIDGHTVVAAQLPTEFDTSLEALIDLIDKHQPALVVCLGQADGRQTISLERVAINIADARIADNSRGSGLAMPHHARGNVTPCWPWYLPPRSL